jgi:hypothetical protein
LIVKIKEGYQCGADWYRRGEVRPAAGQYYVVLRSVLRTKPHLRRCLVRCRHCRIFFLTDPRNAGRVDLRCPFGCQETYRRKSSTERSVGYYGTEEGKMKKKIQNAKRGRKEVVASPADPPEIEKAKPSPEKKEWDEAAVSYIRQVTGLIEGRRVSREEIVEMLERGVRQHGMEGGNRMDYVVDYLKKKDP